MCPALTAQIKMSQFMLTRTPRKMVNGERPAGLPELAPLPSNSDEKSDEDERPDGAMGEDVERRHFANLPPIERDQSPGNKSADACGQATRGGHEN